MRAMNASTASIWASSSRSWRFESTVHGFIRYLSKPRRLVAALDERRGRAAEQPVELRDPPALRDRRDRPQRGDERDLARSRTGSPRARPRPPEAWGRAASASSARMPPRHQPTSCTGRPPASSRGGADRVRDDVLDPVLEPEPAVGVLDLPVVDEVGRAAAVQQVLGDRAAAPQVEADRGRGQRRDEQHRRRACAGAAPEPGGSGGRCAAAPRRSPSRASAAGRRARRRACRRRGSPPPRRARSA